MGRCHYFIVCLADLNVQVKREKIKGRVATGICPINAGLSFNQRFDTSLIL